MSNLREAAQQALDALAGYRREMNLIRGESYMHGQPCDAEIALRAALEQAEPEPVAWMCPEDPERETAFSWKAGHCENCGKQRIPLHAAPPQRKPLTDEELDALAIDEDGLPNSHLEFARAIEWAHGIGEEK